MSKVLNLLFGSQPAFLELKSSKRLFDLISTLPSYGKGRLVQPADWYNLKRTKNYYQITRVCTASKQVFGFRFRGKKMSREYEISSKHRYWGFFKPQKELREIKQHFNSSNGSNTSTTSTPQS